MQVLKIASFPPGLQSVVRFILPVQVFSLDASQNMDAAAARRQLQNYMATMSSFRGRALTGGPLAMPPTSYQVHDQVPALNPLPPLLDALFAEQCGRYG